MFGIGRGDQSSKAQQCDGRHKGVCAYCPEVAQSAYGSVSMPPGSEATKIAGELSAAADKVKEVKRRRT